MVIILYGNLSTFVDVNHQELIEDLLLLIHRNYRVILQIYYHDYHDFHVLVEFYLYHMQLDVVHMAIYIVDSIINIKTKFFHSL